MSSASSDDFAFQVLLLITAGGSTVYGTWLLQKVLKIREWEKVTATILSSDWKLSKYGGLAIVDYRYEVDNQIYKSSRISIDDWLIAQGAWQAHSIQKRFPVGQSVPVFFNPLNPEQSVLLRPGYGWPIALFSVALASVLGCVLVSGITK